MTSPTPQSAGTPEMVEIVALALFNRARKWDWLPDDIPELENPKYYRAMARAAIAAMREPLLLLLDAHEAQLMQAMVFDPALAAPEPPPAPDLTEATQPPETGEMGASDAPGHAHRHPESEGAG